MRNPRHDQLSRNQQVEKTVRAALEAIPAGTTTRAEIEPDETPRAGGIGHAGTGDILRRANDP